MRLEVVHRYAIASEEYLTAMARLAIAAGHIDLWHVHEPDLACCRTEPWISTHGRFLDALRAAGVEPLAVEPTLEKARG